MLNIANGRFSGRTYPQLLHDVRASMVLSAAEVWRWLLLLLSPLLSVGVLVTARTVQGMARVRSGQAPT